VQQVKSVPVTLPQNLNELLLFRSRMTLMCEGDSVFPETIPSIKTGGVTIAAR
jgi:hypothetical protein